MFRKDFSFPVNTETLSAFSMIAKKGDKPTCLLLHGAGNSDKERLKPLAHELVQYGISSIGFDYSGAGSSTSNSLPSIEKRTREAATAITLLDKNKPVILCGFSMSGQVILNLLKQHVNVSHIILCAPGLYDVRALDVEFGSHFTNILRVPDSWKNNNASVLSNFKGSVLVIMGSNDTVIPHEIPEIIIRNAENAIKKELHIISGAPHMLAGWTQDNEENAHYLGKIIGEFIR